MVNPRSDSTTQDRSTVDPFTLLDAWATAQALRSKRVPPDVWEALGLGPSVYRATVGSVNGGMTHADALDLVLEGLDYADDFRAQVAAVKSEDPAPALPPPGVYQSTSHVPLPPPSDASPNGASPNGTGTRGERIGALLAGIQTGPQLGARDFPPTREIIPGFLYEGLNILCGREKSGKTLMMLDNALAVAFGGKAFGTVDADYGEVLFLELEIGEKKLREYGDAMLGEQRWPDGFYYHTKWLKADMGGIQAIAEWLDNHPAALLVVVDTLLAFRSDPKPGRNMLAEDYAALQPLADLAHERQIAIQVGLHSRKMASDNPLDLISGTTGLGAACDTLAILKRMPTADTGSVLITGRNSDARELALGWRYPQWTILGDAGELRRSEERQTILDSLAELVRATPSEIAKTTGMASGNVRRLLFKMVRVGEVTRHGDKYALPAK